MHIYQPLRSGRIWHKRNLTGLNSEVSFSETSCLTKAEEPSLPYYLPIAGGRIIGFIPFPRVLVLCEMQSVSARIWTRVTVSISNYDNHYTTDNFSAYLSQSEYWLHFIDLSLLFTSVYPYLFLTFRPYQIHQFRKGSLANENYKYQPIGIVGGMFAQQPGRPRFIPRWNHTNDSKMVQLHVFSYCYPTLIILYIAQSAGAVQYTNCTSEER